MRILTDNKILSVTFNYDWEASGPQTKMDQTPKKNIRITTCTIREMNGLDDKVGKEVSKQIVKRNVKDADNKYKARKAALEMALALHDVSACNYLDKKEVRQDIWKQYLAKVKKQ